MHLIYVHSMNVKLENGVTFSRTDNTIRWEKGSSIEVREKVDIAIGKI
jgi:hypothetical protein